MSSENGFTDHGLDLRTSNNSFNQLFYESVSVASDLAETHCCSQCSNFDDHFEMPKSVYKDGQNEGFTEGVSKFILKLDYLIHHYPVVPTCNHM